MFIRKVLKYSTTFVSESYCTLIRNRALELDSNLQKDITRVLLNEQMHMSTLWKGQETYYNIFHRAINRFDL
jgi:hypothetical protein